jgi:hypothetical protein
MKRTRRSNAVVYALYANAALLLAILIMLGRDRAVLAAPAFAESAQAPIAGGNGVFVMPCQMQPSMWGCYLLDTDRQTLCAYEYRSGSRALVLTAARHFAYDLQLKNYDTYPAWYDVQRLVQDQDASGRRTEPRPDTRPAESPTQQ